MTRLSCHRTMNNFTPRAQQVLALARKEADRLNHNYVGTEHLLLGIIKLGQGVAVNVLQRVGLDLETVRMELEKHVGSGPETKMVGNIPYTPRVLQKLEMDIERTRMEILKELDPNFVPEASAPETPLDPARSKATPALNALGRDLTEKARKEGFAVTGRDAEIDLIARILARS